MPATRFESNWQFLIIVYNNLRSRPRRRVQAFVRRRKYSGGKDELLIMRAGTSSQWDVLILFDSSIASDRPNKGVGHEDREEFIAPDTDTLLFAFRRYR